MLIIEIVQRDKGFTKVYVKEKPNSFIDTLSFLFRIITGTDILLRVPSAKEVIVSRGKEVK